MKNEKEIVMPLIATRISPARMDFYTAYPLREWSLVKRIKQLAKDNTCGELCSLRFTWQKPKKEASDEQVFLYETLAGLIDIAWLLANAPLATLHIEKVPEKNNLFALAMFENEVAAEFELNECLPDSMPATHFVKANFKNGHVTNQPLVGHFNEEGSILADDSGMERLVIENSDWDDCGGEMEICKRLMMRAIEQGKYPAGALHSAEIINTIDLALGKEIVTVISEAV
jgi:hypothetical protein